MKDLGGLSSPVDTNFNPGDTSSPLQLAAQGGHLSIVRGLFKYKADYHATDGCTALFYAAFRGHGLVVQDDEGRTAFSLAVENGHIAIVQELLPYVEHKQEPELDDQHPFYLAVKNGHSNIVQLLLDSQWDINTRRSDQQTLLHVAAAGPLPIVNLLLKAEAVVDATDEDGCTPLFYAATDNNVEVVKAHIHAAYDSPVITKLLLDAGANVHAKNKEGRIPLVKAASEDYEDTFRVILNQMEETSVLSSGDLSSAVLGAVESGSLEMVKSLVEKGASFLDEDNDENTVLHLAASSGSKPVLEYLIGKGAGIHLNKLIRVYGTPLMAVARARSADVTETLLEIGADVNATGGRYHSAIQMASRMGREETVRLLLNKKADPNLTSRSFGNALIAAIYDGSKTVVELLLDAEADTNKRDQDQNTPLQTAAMRGREKLIGILLKRGVKANDTGGAQGFGNERRGPWSKGSRQPENLDLDEKDIAGYIPLMTAVRQRSDIVKVLLEKGANPNIADASLSTPLIQAVILDYQSIVETLLKYKTDPTYT
ncbi:hypothetical protein G7Y89_g15607 [Cudoniella acicularis]|uniref:Ankyrin n=1 Tax=Cudoniella acicularis TaxID=354080 RepID=A0A8H4QJX0_9HELO|nr:hypothetical protein G7Y89_g15607 [Cudoniella acicularis]